MDEQLIMNMVEQHVNDDILEYKKFESIFYMLNDQEKYDAEQILKKHGIEIILEEELMPILENDNDAKFDEDLFKDSIIDENINSSTIYRKNIKQSNEILCHLIQQGNKQAEQDLCIKNKKLVYKYVHIYMKYYKNKLDYEDLEQAGFIGLLIASKKYKVEFGNRFSTYAIWWIKQTITREIIQNGQTIRIPIHILRNMNTVTRLDRKYVKININERIKKIAKECSFSEDEVRKIYSLITNVFSCRSLNAFTNEEERNEVIELLENNEPESVEDTVARIEQKQAIKEVLSTLKEKEQKIIKLRFGIDDEKADCKTLEFIAGTMNVTRERIRQIEKSILKKLKFRMFKFENYKDLIV
jgi:RNA polymerase primary sigma factor